MCDQTEIPYKHGDVVWVKFGKCFWPGQVVGVDNLPEDVADSVKKNTIAVVQFFDEDQYEFVKNLDQISLYNGRRKLEFIKKGIDLFENQKGRSTFMNKFPEDVKKAERLTGGNPNILTDPQLTPKEKSSYQGIFDGNKTSPKKDKTASASPKKRGRPPLTSRPNGRKSSAPAAAVHTPRPITHPRFVKGEPDHDVRIRDQSATKASPTTDATPTTPKTDAAYKCHVCDFTSTRVNVIVLHSKFHSGEAANQVKGKGSAGKNKTGTPKARASLSTTATKPRANAKTKAVVEPKVLAKVSSPVPTNSKPVTSPKSATKRKITEDDDAQISDDKSSPSKAKVKAKETTIKKSLKSPEKVIDKKSPKVTNLGKRKLALASEKAAGKKSKNDEEIREQLLADWDDEDAEQERKELEELKKKKISEERATKEASCFDFDDSKDAILDSELEERAKKFVESRKNPREKVENSKDVSRPIALGDSEKEGDAASPEDFDKAIDSLLAQTVVPELPQVPSGLLPDVVLDTASESKTDIPATGEHDYSARTVDDIAIADDIDILDINSMPVVMTDDIMTEEPSTSQVSFVEMPKIDLIPNADLASTPAIVFSQEEIKMPTSVKSLVKAVRTSMADQSKFVSKATVLQASLKPTVSTVTRKLAPTGVVSKGIAAGKYVIVQSPSGQNSRLQLAPTPATSLPMPGKVTVLSKPTQKPPAGQHKLLFASPSQQKLVTALPQGQKLLNVTTTQPKGASALPSGQQKILTITPKQQKYVTNALSGQQKVITVTPKPQKLLTVTTAQQKLLSGLPAKPQQQLLMTSSGQFLTQVTQKGGLPPPGAKFAPVRTLAPGKPLLGPRLTMQSLQTKVCLPTLKPVHGIASPGMRILSPQSSTILIKSTQSIPVATTTTPRLIRSQVAPASTNQSAKIRPVQQPAALRPKILQSRATGQQVSKTAVQKPNTTMGIVSSMQPVTGLVTQAQAIQKITQSTANTRLISQPRKPVGQPALKRAVASSQPRPAVTIPQQTTQYSQLVQKATAASPAVSNNVELIAEAELPPLAPLQSTGNMTLALPEGSGLSLPSFQTCSVATPGSTGLTSEQLAQVMASPQVSQLGDAGAAGAYVFLTIDEAGNLQYNNNHLISYDAGDGSSQTLYIGPGSLEAGGDLENMILRIDGSDVGGGLELSESSTTWMPSTSQDILAAALANTDVFQSDTVDTSSLLGSIPSTLQDSLIPSTLLLPSLNRTVTTAANVSETSLTLNQPIMSPLEVTSSSVTSFRAPPSVSAAPSVTSVYAPAPPAYHPSMPLLSEETAHYGEGMGLQIEANEATHFPNTYEAAGDVVAAVTSADSGSYEQDSGSYEAAGDVVAAVTSADSGSYEQDSGSYEAAGDAVAAVTSADSGSYEQDPAVDSLGSADAPTACLADHRETPSVPATTDSSHSMPLLCDDSVYGTAGQRVTDADQGSREAAGDAMGGMTVEHCEVTEGDPSSSVDVAGAGNSLSFVEEETGDNSGA